MSAQRRLSARRPLPWACWLPLVGAGLVAGQSAGFSNAAVAFAVAAAAAGACPALWLRHRRIGSAASLIALGALLGTLQAGASETARLASAASFTGGGAELRGQIVALRPQRARGGARAVALDLRLTVAAPPLAIGQRARVTLWSTAREWHVGEAVRGRVAQLRVPRGFCNDGGDGYARAMWRQGVLATASAASDRGWTVVDEARPWRNLDAALHAARQAIARALASAVSDGSARVVLAALVYGDQSDVPAELRRAYARTGTAHVLSVSGLHIAVVAMTCFALARRLLARWPWLAVRVLVVRPAAAIALLPATLYALLSGGAVATMRSLAMGALALGGVVLLRRADLWTALAAAAIVLCLADPGVAAEPSFQLSFVAVAGLVAVGRRWDGWCRTRGLRWLDPSRVVGRVGGSIAGAVVAALAAGAATAPITAFHFGSVATLGVLANLVVVPLVGTGALLVALTGAVLLPVWPAAAGLLFTSASWCVVPANAFVSWLATSRWCALDLALASPVEVACVMTFLAAVASPAGTIRKVLVAAGCALAIVRAGEFALDTLAPQLEVHFLDVGQGDAILVRLPRSEATVLVDGGGLGGALDPGERVVVPALRRSGTRLLDAIAMTHPDFDHYGGLAAVASALPVREFWSSGRSSDNPTFRALTEILRERDVWLRRLAAGSDPVRAGGAVARVVHPAATLRGASDNDASLALLLSYGASRVLLTGDLQARGEAALLGTSPDVAATVVKVPHHGSRTSSTRGLVARTQPGLAVALLGFDNRFHFPASEVRERWRRGGARWLATADAGEVVVRSDGQLEVVASCRQLPGGSVRGEEVGVVPGSSGEETAPGGFVVAARASLRRALSIWLKRNESS